LSFVDGADARITIWLCGHRLAALNGVAVWLGRIEKLGAVWIALAFLVGLYLWRAVLAAAGLAMLVGVTTAAADAASLAVKNVVERPRPFQAHHDVHPLYAVHSSSFPAGHAATAFAGALIIGNLLPRARPFCVALAVAIGLSRIYVGDHYPTDVLAGAFLGTVVAGGVLMVLVAVGRHMPPRFAKFDRLASIPGS
jgi:undecaprenyl-diphosphatase